MPSIVGLLTDPSCTGRNATQDRVRLKVVRRPPSKIPLRKEISPKKPSSTAQRLSVTEMWQVGTHATAEPRRIFRGGPTAQMYIEMVSVHTGTTAQRILYVRRQTALQRQLTTLAGIPRAWPWILPGLARPVGNTALTLAVSERLRTATRTVRRQYAQRIGFVSAFCY